MALKQKKTSRAVLTSLRFMNDGVCEDDEEEDRIQYCVQRKICADFIWLEPYKMFWDQYGH